MGVLIELMKENVMLGVLMIISFFVFFFIIGVMIGNVTTMRILHAFGIPAFSGKILKDYRVLKSINKDGIGWLHIPDTCYSPVMVCSDGFYKTHNFKKKESKYGELYITDSKNTFDLQKIANKSDNGIKDLTIINGSTSVLSRNIKRCKFTYLKKYTNSDLKNRFPDIYLVDNGKLRIFNLLFAVEIGLENRKVIKFTDRATFIKAMRGMAYVDTGRSADNDIIILSGSNGIDTLLMFLVEKEG